jgi:cytochrome c5
MANGMFVFAAATLLLVSGSAWAQPKGDPQAGEKIYKGTCIACHGANGKGAIPGAPDFAAPDGPLAEKSDSVLLKHILDGFQSPGSPIAMPPDGGNPNLTIRDIRNVLAYLHDRFHYRAHFGSGPK